MFSIALIKFRSTLEKNNINIKRKPNINVLIYKLSRKLIFVRDYNRGDIVDCCLAPERSFVALAKMPVSTFCPFLKL